MSQDFDFFQFLYLIFRKFKLHLLLTRRVNTLHTTIPTPEFIIQWQRRWVTFQNWFRSRIIRRQSIRFNWRLSIFLVSENRIHILMVRNYLRHINLFLRPRVPLHSRLELLIIIGLSPWFPPLNRRPNALGRSRRTYGWHNTRIPCVPPRLRQMNLNNVCITLIIKIRFVYLRHMNYITSPRLKRNRMHFI